MKLAIVIPTRRLWGWHAILVDHLKKSHAVEVFFGEDRRYSMLLRAFLFLERIFGKQRPGARQVGLSSLDAPASALTRLKPGAHELILDLTGAEKNIPGALWVSYDGRPEEGYLFGKLLAFQSPRLAIMSDLGVVAASYPAVEDREVLLRALDTIFARVVTLLVRAVERGGRLEEEGHGTGPTSPAVSYSTGRLLVFAAAQAKTKLLRQVTKRFFRQNHWCLALARRTDGGKLFAIEDVKPVAKSPDLYFADPFLYEAEGQKVLFAEEFPYATRRGILVCAGISDQGEVEPFRTVLERPYHLSYPFVFHHEGEHFMIPETSRNGTVELYRCLRFPDQWILDTILMRDVTLADATLLFQDGLWWLFGAERRFGGSSQDELYAYHGQTLRGPWLPHPLNPLISDARSARPGGRFVRWNGKLYRPAQNCEAGYGAALEWREVLELTPERFRERQVASWEGPHYGPYTGLHTYDCLGNLAVIDLKQRYVRRTGT